MNAQTPIMSQDELLAQIAKLKADNAKLAAAAATRQRITCKVSEKGACSVYGLGRFPVTLYRTQWERLLNPETIKAIQSFMIANASLLAVKD